MTARRNDGCLGEGAVRRNIIAPNQRQNLQEADNGFSGAGSLAPAVGAGRPLALEKHFGFVSAGGVRVPTSS
jgi:hypothetical protein